MGCPVARTSFTATDEQVAFLEQYGHLGESSGFVKEEGLTVSGLHKISQGPYTAIDDVLWHWGDYLLRYGTHLLGRGVNPSGIAPTDANQVILLG